MKLVFVCLLLFILLFQNGSGLIHKLRLSEEDRSLFKIESFGFNGGGSINITVSDFELNEYQHYNATAKPTKVGFLLRKARTETTAQQDLETFIENNDCMLDPKFHNRDDLLVDLENVNSPMSKRSVFPQTIVKSHRIKPKAAGFYTLVFVRCHSIENHFATVSFSLVADFHNVGPNYLSAGDMPLPAIYMVFFVLFSIATFAWCYILHQSSKNGTASVYTIHYIMATLVAIKALSLLFESIRYHYIALVGATELWSVVYYIFTTVKGIMLFIVILLIGSGWSLMKGYLNDREKMVVLVVLVMQVVNNVAMVILDETAPGSKSWLLWRDTLHIVDILCCCAILFPVLWSIRHLRQAAEVDGKAAEAKMKLEIFRRFYIMVITYVYFTRIVVDLIEASIPYYMLWLGPFCSEMASLLFFVATGYQFQPSAFGANSYTAVDTYDPHEAAGVRGPDEDFHSDRLDRQIHRVGNNKSELTMGMDVELAPMETNSDSNMNNSASVVKANNPMSALELSE